jgi:hypothetical protein
MEAGEQLDDEELSAVSAGLAIREEGGQFVVYSTHGAPVFVAATAAEAWDYCVANSRGSTTGGR